MSITNLTEVFEGQMVIPALPGTELREPGNPLYVGKCPKILEQSWADKDDIILPYTLESGTGEKNDPKKQYVYYSIGNKKNPNDWKHMGRLPIFSDGFGMSVYHKLEDPFFEYYEPESQIRIYCEDKDRPGHTIVMYYTYIENWNYKTNTMKPGKIWDGGKTTLAPSDKGAGKKAVYSFISWRDPAYWYFYEARDTEDDDYRNISIAYGGNRDVVLHYTDDWNIVVADVSIKIGDKRIVFGHGKYKGEWQCFIVDATNPLSWKFITGKPIKLPTNSWADIIPVLFGEWHVLYNDSGNGLRLGTIKDDGEPIIEPPPIIDPNKFVFPPGIKDTDYNTILMRYAKKWLSKLTIKSGEENILQTAYDYIDEIGHYDPFDNV